jgi:FixJ family two-component response regulator
MTCSVLLQYIAAKNHIYPTKLWLLSYNNKYHDIPNLSNTAVTTETTERKVRRTRKTRQQIEKELMDIEHRICQGLTDKKIMEELGIKERMFYYYKQKSINNQLKFKQKRQ